ncbi:predicted protein [Naegleria gruberi]|uniref:Predicted protein n=1 Tax=Naegleria gruberi TaxID=5762 RepID=D2W2D0_NAEGR|nr:uncharacterized protein NAEGRDRAFT_75545 [Naegleria gruberi]EFC36805.1 predicted protein [Naegleria gruberi]|eukprot:XP_002669549.1 predicted protein [Naegleria gruberi strain NEG-M]
MSKQTPSPGYYDEEIEEACRDLSRKILKLNKGQVDAKQKQAFFDSVDEDFKSLQKIYKGMFRSVQMEGVDASWKKKLSQHKSEIAKLLQNFQTAKEKSNKDELLGATTEKKKETSKKKTNKTKDDDDEVVEVVASEKSASNKTKNEQIADELFKEIYETQGDSLDIVKRLIDKADETKAIAAESMEMLKRQREQLERIDKEMDELGSNITRGSNELKSFMRRLATDKLIMVLILLVVLAVLGIIIWRIVDYCVNKFMPKQNNNNSGNTTPQKSTTKTTEMDMYEQYNPSDYVRLF